MRGDPETIGRYRVLRPLGAGAMGAVYLAEDPLLKRQVAIKLVQAAGSSVEQALTRFQREAEISARLNHPNVITIYDVGEDPQHGPFLAMEFIDGQSLTELIRAGGLDDARRLRILIFAMQGLEAAHAIGIVHRDVKPSNLMIGRDGRVKLMDFGIARDDEVGLSSTGAVLGTPAYIAPEQLKGGSPSAATDRYAFAVLAFELFAGARPFRAETASAMFYNIVNSPPSIPEGMPPPLAQALLRSLAKEPAERFPTLRAFVGALLEGGSLDPVSRARLTALLEAAATSPPEDPAATAVVPTSVSADRPGGAFAEAPVVVPDGITPGPRLEPGLGLGAIVGAGGGILVLATLAAWFVLSPGGRGREAPEMVHVEPTPAPITVARADPTPAPAITEAVPTAAPLPTAAPPPTAEIPSEPVGPPVADGSSPQQREVMLSPSPDDHNARVALVAPEKARVSPPPGSGTSSRDVEERIRRELARRDLTHVTVRVDKDLRVRLGDLDDGGEEKEARRAVAAAAPRARIVEARMRGSRQRLTEPEGPTWGTIQGGQAEQTE